MMPSDTVCPRSGWATMSASAMTAAGTSGISISRSDARSMRRAASRCAPQIANAILASSEGCMERPATTNQPRDPLASVPIPGNQHQDQQDDREREARERQPPHQSHPHPHRRIERDQADHRPQHLPGEDRPRGPVLVVGVHPGGRQHHDQAQRGEQGGDRDDEVKRRHRPAQPGAEPGARAAGRPDSAVASAGLSSTAPFRRCRNRVRMLLTAGYRVAARTAAANASPRSP